MMFEYYELRIYWKQRNGNKKLIKRFRFSDKPPKREAIRIGKEYGADAIEVVRV